MRLRLVSTATTPTWCWFPDPLTCDSSRHRYLALFLETSKQNIKERGICILHFDHRLPPPLWDSFFLPAYSHEAPPDGSGEGKTPVNIFRVYDPKKYAISRTFTLFLCKFLPLSFPFFFTLILIFSSAATPSAIIVFCIIYTLALYLFNLITSRFGRKLSAIVPCCIFNLKCEICFKFSFDLFEALHLSIPACSPTR